MSDPAEVITVTLGGMTFRAGRRTAAHLEWTIERLAEAHPDARLVVIQPCYHTGVTASAGTHDKDGVLDVEIIGLGWLEAQAFLRRHGWAAWWRFPPTFGNHIHMISLGCPGPVGSLIPSQIDDYYAHRTGLKGHARDATWHPRSIAATIFDYPAYLEAHMPLNDSDLAQVEAKVRSLIPEIVDAFLDALVDDDPEISVRRALRRAGKPEADAA